MEKQLVNGKHYPMWSQFVERSQEWVGGVLEDYGDPSFPCYETTEIAGITLEPNGDTSAYFSVSGKEFTCGFDVGHGGVAAGDEGWITFRGYGGHKWRIREPQ